MPWLVIYSPYTSDHFHVSRIGNPYRQALSSPMRSSILSRFPRSFRSGKLGITSALSGTRRRGSLELIPDLLRRVRNTLRDSCSIAFYSLATSRELRFIFGLLFVSKSSSTLSWSTLSSFRWQRASIRETQRCVERRNKFLLSSNNTHKLFLSCYPYLIAGGATPASCPASC